MGRLKCLPLRIRPLKGLTELAPIVGSTRFFIAPHEPKGTAVAIHADLLPSIPLGVTIGKPKQGTFQVATSIGISVGGEVIAPVFRPSEPYNMALRCHAPVVAHTPRGEECAF